MMNNEELESKIAQLRLLEAHKTDLEAAIDAIKNDLKSELDSRKADMIDTGLQHIFYSVYERPSVDTSKLKADGIYEDYLKKSTVISFKVTDVKCATE